MDCAALSKTLLVVLNGVTLLTGLCMLGLSIAIAINPSLSVSFATVHDFELNHLSEITGGGFINVIRSGVYFMIAVSILICLISIFGFCGACKQNTCLLIIYSIF